jgi:hypothetical protein
MFDLLGQGLSFIDTHSLRLGIADVDLLEHEIYKITSHRIFRL